MFYFVFWQLFKVHHVWQVVLKAGLCSPRIIHVYMYLSVTLSDSLESFLLLNTNDMFIQYISCCVLQSDTIATRRACSLQALAVYLSEDPEKMVKEYMVSVISCFECITLCVSE